MTGYIWPTSTIRNLLAFHQEATIPDEVFTDRALTIDTFTGLADHYIEAALPYAVDLHREDIGILNVHAGSWATTHLTIGWWPRHRPARFETVDYVVAAPIEHWADPIVFNVSCTEPTHDHYQPGGEVVELHVVGWDEQARTWLLDTEPAP